MFNLFKNKQNDQRAQFNKDFYQFLKEYDKLIKKNHDNHKQRRR